MSSEIDEDVVKLRVSSLVIFIVGALALGCMVAAVLDRVLDSHPRYCCSCREPEPRPKGMYMCPECREKLEKKP